MTSTKPDHNQAHPQKDIRRISNPQRLLVLTPASHAHNTIPSFLHALTGSPVSHSGLQREQPPLAGNAQNQETTPASTDAVSQSVSFAGYITHAPLQLKTKYFSADIPIWVDEIALSSRPSPSVVSKSSTERPQIQPEPAQSTPSAWSTTFLAPPAAEVRAAIGAILILLHKPSYAAADTAGAATAHNKRRTTEQINNLKDVIQSVANVKRKIEEERSSVDEPGTGEVPGLVVIVGDEGGGRDAKEKGDRRGDDILEDGTLGMQIQPYGVSWWDEILTDMGIYEFEVVGWDPTKEGEEKKRNEFGELQGMPRIREVLEASEWAMASNEEEFDGFATGLLGDLEDQGLDLGVGELEREMLGLRMAINDRGDDGTESKELNEDDLDADKLEMLMHRVQAIKDMGADLPEAERKRFAAKAIRDLMKDV